jgi:hypothetical protein
LYLFIAVFGVTVAAGGTYGNGNKVILVGAAALIDGAIGWFLA